MEESQTGEPEMKKFGVNGKEVKLISETKAEVNGEIIEFSYSFIDENFMILRINGVNHYIKALLGDSNIIEVEENATVQNVECKDETEMLIEAMGYESKSDRQKNEIISPMPGVIVKINASEGQEVKKGDVLLVLEAMKMENEIKASRDCKVKKVSTKEKKSVEKNELLMVLE